MLTEWLKIFFEVERLAFRFVLLQMVIGITHTVLSHLRSRAITETAADVTDITWPLVTIQLPMRNEFYVADRVIRAAAALDYPRDRLEIQVLDDSTDETVALVDATVAEIAATGINVRTVRRTTREGFKAGHLALGLTTAVGEFVAIFDADFIPPPDFLRRTIPILLDNERVGMVQGRWGFLNRTASFLTRVQAMILYGLMLVEQPAKSRRRYPFQFNGTAGVWRRTCIEDAGGWRGDSVVEDLDLSYRSMMKGWRFVHLPDLVSPTELPETMIAFRAQQTRWTRGNSQVLRALGLKVLGSDLSIWHRISMLMHLGGRIIYVLIAFLALTMPLTTFEWVKPLFDYSILHDGLTLGLVVFALAVFYVPAQFAAHRSFWSALFVVPLTISLNIGLSICCTFAFVNGLFSKEAVFVRTPKTGGGAARATGPSYRPSFDIVAAIEGAVAIAYVYFTWLAASKGYVAHALFFGFFALSFLWVSGTSILGWFESVSGASEARRKAGELAARLVANASASARTGSAPGGRAAVVERVSAELARAHRNGGHLSLVLVSQRPTDGAGSSASASLATSLRSSLRPYDLVVDLDTSTVALVLAGSGAANDEQVIARVRTILDGAGRGAPSIAIAHGTSDVDETAEELTARAERELAATARDHDA